MTMAEEYILRREDYLDEEYIIMQMCGTCEEKFPEEEMKCVDDGEEWFCLACFPTVEEELKKEGRKIE